MSVERAKKSCQACYGGNSAALAALRDSKEPSTVHVLYTLARDANRRDAMQALEHELDRYSGKFVKLGEESERLDYCKRALQACVLCQYDKPIIAELKR